MENFITRWKNYVPKGFPETNFTTSVERCSLAQNFT